MDVSTNERGLLGEAKPIRNMNEVGAMGWTYSLYKTLETVSTHYSILNANNLAQASNLTILQKVNSEKGVRDQDLTQSLIFFAMFEF